ncbi:MAG: sigma-70 family RNA polymerase sigma factor [Candidatus Auribacterota bacterium]|nr:sigma-70 family RNA polymerase sigma factor [Candidatus Auribacterota bacterium]
MPENFEDIFYSYKDLVWSIINSKHISSADADDVFMESWHSIRKSLRNYRGEARLQSWIGTIVYRRCADYWTSRPARGTFIPLDGDKYPDLPSFIEPITPRDILISEEVISFVHEVLEDLDEDHRFVIEKRLEGFLYREIAEMMDNGGTNPLDTNWVGKKIYEAKMQIIDILRSRNIFSPGDILE